MEIFNMGKRLPGNYCTISWKMSESGEKRPRSNELYHFHNATKLNCNTNDEINMEFISINIKWNTEFNIFARCCVSLFFFWYRIHSAHKMFKKCIFPQKMFILYVNYCESKLEQVLHCHRKEKNPVFGSTQTHVRWQNRNNDVYKWNNPFLTQCYRLAASTNNNHHYHRRDSHSNGKNCCYCEFQFDFCACI